MANPQTADLGLIRDELLRRMYLAYFPAQDALLVREVMREHGWDEGLMWRALEQMSRQNLTKLRDSGPNYKLLPLGVVEAEQRKLVPLEMCSLQQSIRTLLLSRYAEAYEAANVGERGGLYRQAVAIAVATESGADEALVMANHDFLVAAGQLDHPGSLGYYVITDEALHAIHEWRKHAELERTFADLHEVAPASKRGREFQTLFGALARAEAWTVDESEGGSGEELDLIINRGDVFYILECRWTADPVEANAIRDFQGKVRKRAGVFGVFISMSGYTRGAVEEVEGGTGECPVLLIGPDEVAGLFARTRKFDELLNEKRRALVLRRETHWK